MTNFIKKHKFDLIVVVGLILVSGISWAVISLINQPIGSYAQIVVNGEVTEVFSLSQNGEYKISGTNFVNIIEIKDGQIFMKEADCPDKLCVKQGKISKDGQSIICLPHKVVIKVTSEKEDKADAHTH